MKKLAVFDFDSTLMDGETIDFLAQDMGVMQEVSEITQKAMQGELDFYESLKYRVSLLKGMKLQRAKDICADLPLMNGSHTLIQWLKKNDYIVLVFSGGFQLATSSAKEKLLFDADFSNTLHHKQNTLTGEVGGEMMFADSKGIMLKRIQSLLTVSETIAIGDGANDLSMFAHASTRIAFCAKPALKEKADIIIDEKNLELIISHLS